MRIQFILGEIAGGLRRNKSMIVSVVLVTMVSMFFLGAGLLAQRQVDTAKGYWYDKVQISIFLCTAQSSERSCASGAVSAGQRQQVKTDLDQMKPLVKTIYYESQDQALSRFRQQFRNSPVVNNITAASMPESYRVKLSDPSKFAIVASAFSGAPGVESVQDQRALLAKFFEFLNAISLSAVGLALVMVICSVLLIATTIRQTAFSRRKETGIMRLVGASAFVIHLPFIIETVIATVVGSILAMGLLWGVVHYGITGFLATNISGGLVSFIGVDDVWAIAPYLFGGAILLAVLTSWATLRRYLRV